jgi:hypothetical protein
MGELRLPKNQQEKHNRELRPLLHQLLQSSRVLKLCVETTFTAAVLLHRFKIASQETNRHIIDTWIITSCLLLACKREEEPRRLRDFINCAYLMQQRPLPDLDDAYWEDKKKIVRTEQIVLRWLEFDITVSRPHRAIVAILRYLSADNNERERKECRELAQSAFRKLNDTIFSVEALQQEADILAIAALRLAILDDPMLSEDRRKQLLDFPTWGKQFGVDCQIDFIQQVQDIVRQAAGENNSQDITS